MTALASSIGCVFVLGCEIEPAPQPPTAIVLDRAELTLDDGVRVVAASAVLDEGQGTATTTSVAASTPGPPPLQIEAPRSDWDLKKRSARFEGGVRLVRGDVTLTCRELDVAYGDPGLSGEERVQRAVATGDVLVRKGGRVARGASAELAGATGEIALTGSPVIEEGPNRMTGDRIVLLLDDERVRCENCRLVVDGRAIGPRR